MAAARTSAALELRKLRKKLRQIENLERLDRDLTDEEFYKVDLKAHIREKLLQLLAVQKEEFDESFASTTRSDTSSHPEDIDASTSLAPDDLSLSLTETADISGTAEVTVISREEEDNGEIDIEAIDDQEGFIEVTVTPKSSHNKSKSSRKEIVPPSETSSPKKKQKTEKESPAYSVKDVKLKAIVQMWRNCQFNVIELEGHSDLITDVDTDGDLLVSASRDTTFKLWNLDDMKALRNYGGHTSTVTSVTILNKDLSAKICKKFGREESDEQVIISGSLDCSYKVWSTVTGQTLKSTYTYNPVTKIVYHPVAEAIITGSDGGKVEMWDIETGENLHSICCYDNAVTGLQVKEERIFTCSAEGEIKVFMITDSQLSCLFASEHLKSVTGGHLTQRHIRGMTVSSDRVYYGDDGVNIKVLNWGKGVVSKLVNHSEEFGITDSLCCYDNILLSTAYSLDTGNGYLNVRYLPDGNYISTLDDDDTDRIIAITCTSIYKDQVAIVTGGMQLKVWLLTTNNEHQEADLINSKFITKLAGQARDSDDESDTDFSDIDEDAQDYRIAKKRSSAESLETRKEQCRRERKRQRREEEEEEEIKQEREEERRNQALVSVSGGSPSSKVTGEPSIKRKRTEEDSGNHSANSCNVKRTRPEGLDKTKVKKVKSLHTMAANSLIACFNKLPDGKAQDVSEKWNLWVGDVITHSEFMNLIVNRRKRRRSS